MTTLIHSSLRVRPITPADNPYIAAVIRTVSAEFGLTSDKGYTVSDPNLDHLYELYSEANSAYWVVEVEGNVVGGGGLAPLQGGDADVCELQKMYFLPDARGMGVARTLALQALEYGREQGFKRCYLETTVSLTRAIRLYEQLGFQHIDGPMGYTGHVDCEVTMLKAL